jgi:hypothetical protein
MGSRAIRRKQCPGGTQVFELRGRIRDHRVIHAARQGAKPRSGGCIIGIVEISLFMVIGQVALPRSRGIFDMHPVSETATGVRGDPLWRTAADAVVHGAASGCVDGQDPGEKRQMGGTKQHDHCHKMQREADLKHSLTVHMLHTKTFVEQIAIFSKRQSGAYRAYCLECTVLI